MSRTDTTSLRSSKKSRALNSRVEWSRTEVESCQFSRDRPPLNEVLTRYLMISPPPQGRVIDVRDMGVVDSFPYGLDLGTGRRRGCWITQVIQGRDGYYCYRADDGGARKFFGVILISSAVTALAAHKANDMSHTG